MEVKLSNLDEDGVVFRSCYERPLFAQNQSVVLHRTPVKCQSNRVNFLQRQQRLFLCEWSWLFDQPGLNFTDGDIPKSLRTSVWHASPCLRTVAWGVNLQKANFNQVRRIFPFLLQSFPLCQLYLGGVVISSPNYINLLLKEFSWVSLFFRSAMQFW